MLWLAFADDALGALGSMVFDLPLTATRLALAATTILWVGLAGRSRTVLAHLAVTWATAVAVVVTAEQRPDALAAAAVVVVVLPIGVAGARRRSAHESRVLRTAAEHDALTGLANRRGLDQWALDAAPARLTVIALDVDGLKALNDRAGHAAGDAALQAVAAALGAELRAGQLATRLGGDEFAFVALHHGDPPSGMAARVFSVALGAARTHEVTVSAGMVSGRIQAASDLAGLLARADAGVLSAKAGGGCALVLTD